MSLSSPQFTYILLVLPFLFGLTLIGDGISKLMDEEAAGVLSVIVGIVFLGMVILAYFFLPPYLAGGGS